jgi:hypothetical protein
MTGSCPLTYPKPEMKVLNGVKRCSRVSISVHNVTFRWLPLPSVGYRSQSLLTSAATRMDSCGMEPRSKWVFGVAEAGIMSLVTSAATF